MGWRYEVIIIGFITFVVFFVRCLIFKFYESPKFLISKGRDNEAIETLQKIAKFNKVPAPTLTMEDFHRIDLDSTISPPSGNFAAKNFVADIMKHMNVLRRLFLSNMQCFTFILLAIAYMVSFILF